MTKLNILFTLLLRLVCSETIEFTHQNDLKLLVVTVATDNNDGLQRYLKSAEHFNIKPLVVGLGEKWQGGDLRYDTGGAQKINMLQKALKPHENDENTVLLFTDAYDVIFQDGSDKILTAFLESKARILFSAEDLLWPDLSLESEYPEVEGKRFLCSGGIIGYAKEFTKLINLRADVKDDEDDQLYYTKFYLNPETRESLGMKLDHNADIFQNMNGARKEMELNENKLLNIKYNTQPMILHGNGPAKIDINWFGNYVPQMMDVELGFKDESPRPEVTIALFHRTRKISLDF